MGDDDDDDEEEAAPFICRHCCLLYSYLYLKNKSCMCKRNRWCESIILLSLSLCIYTFFYLSAKWNKQANAAKWRRTR